MAEQEVRVRQEKQEAYLQEQDQVWRARRGGGGVQFGPDGGNRWAAGSPAGRQRESRGKKRGANVGAGRRREGGAAGNNSFRFLLMSRPETLLFLPKEELQDGDGSLP